MSGASDHTLIREEVAGLLRCITAHASVAACHAEAGTDRLLAAEVRCAAAAMLAVADLIQHLTPNRQQERSPRSASRVA